MGILISKKETKGEKKSNNFGQNQKFLLHASTPLPQSKVPFDPLLVNKFNILVSPSQKGLLDGTLDQCSCALINVIPLKCDVMSSLNV